MKKLIFILCFSFFFANISFANTSIIKEKIEVTEELQPCTVQIKGTFDGVEVDLEITVDASWVECTFLKRGIRKAVEEALNN